MVVFLLEDAALDAAKSQKVARILNAT